MSVAAPPTAREAISPLSGWTLLSLRPVGEHAGLRRAATTVGARVLAMSPLRLCADANGAAIERALHADLVICSSPAAVRMSRRAGALRQRTGQTWLAPGSGTAAALKRLGIAALAPETQMNSEGLLALSALAPGAVRGKAIAILGAPGGRGLLAAELRRRGARVDEVPVYRRVRATLSARQWSRLAALPADQVALLVTSAEAWAAWWGQCPPAQVAAVRALPAVVASERLRALLAADGMRVPHVAANARPRSLLAALIAGLP